MNKGFMFSIDALLAIALIISASLAFAMLVQKSDSELLILQNKRIAANDDAITGFYLKAGNNLNGGTVASVLDSKKTAYCSKYYSYNLVNAGVFPTDFCEGN